MRTTLPLACIYSSHESEISKILSPKYVFWWATSFIFYEIGRKHLLTNLHENWKSIRKHIELSTDKRR